MVDRKKKLKLYVLFILLAIFLVSIFSCNLYQKPYISSATDYQRLELNKSIDNSNYVNSLKAASVSSPVVDELNISNVVIFIYFKDESNPEINESTIAKFTGEQDSLTDYYYDISYGKIIISTFYAATENGESYIYHAYQATQSRSYYESIKYRNFNRATVERELLMAAIVDFNQQMDYTDVDLDKNGDGNVDSVSFVISGSYVDSEANWGGLMWPHSLVMSALNVETNKPNIYINNKIVEYYTFNFLDKLTTGLICHEFAHVLGAPDLYHYNNDKNYYQVAYWDLMHFECRVPQYMTTYMRYKYLGAKSIALSNLYTSKISQITTSGDFTLKPATTVGKEQDDFLAYKIEIDENESIWIEYRNKEVGLYDSELPGSGLILYRVNNKATLGNQNGQRHDVNNPDEVYVYRPSISNSSVLKDREKENLAYACLGSGDYLGERNTTSLYDDDCIYLTNGVNTGIVITVNSEPNEEISFNVNMPNSLSSANQVAKVEVLDKVKYDTYGIKDSNIIVGYRQNILNTLGNSVKVIITYKDNTSYIATMDNVKFVFDTQKIGMSQQATVRYSDSYNNNIVGYFNLIIRDGVFNASVNSFPNLISYRLGAELDLSGLIISITYASGSTSTIAYVDAPERFSYIGFDSNKSGLYKVEVTYTDELGNKDVVIIDVSVIADIKSISINTKNSRQLIAFTENTDYDTIVAEIPSLLEVIGTQEDETSVILDYTAYSIKPFNYTGTGTAYSIVAQLSIDKTIESQAYPINIVNSTNISNVTLVTLPQLDYRYGESLDLSKGLLRVEIEQGTSSYGISLEGFYDEFNDNQYDCTRSGKQLLTVDIYGFTISFTVDVGSDTTQLLTVNADSIYMKTGIKNYLRSAHSITLSDFVSSIASVFTVKVYYNNMLINVDAYKNMLVSNKISIQLFNDNNVIVADFYTSIIGDTDSNGILDTDDINELAKTLVTNKNRNDNYDINLDGIYDIVDFVLLIEKVRK